MPSQHISTCPISAHYLEEESAGVKLPLKLAESLYVEDVSDILEKTNFDPLIDQFYSKSEVESLRRTRYALTRRFACEDWVSHEENRNSEALLYQLYLGLKMIRPSGGRFEVLHYDLDQAVPRLPRGSRNDYSTIPCDCDLLIWPFNLQSDLDELAALTPSILGTLKDARNPISQAVNSLEIGYRGDFLNVRHLLWVIGLDALVTSTEWENRGKEVAIERVTDFLGTNFEIYPEKPHPNYSSGPTLPNLKLKEVVHDVYRLRNDFAHGTWPDKAWAGKVSRRSADDARDIYYAEVLSEAASSILRGCLRKIFADPHFVQRFRDKTKMNDHFRARGLVRKTQKKIHARP